MTPVVSVLMPVYNCEKYVAEAVDSILCQAFRDLEFIIIDDCSTDSTGTIIRSQSDSRIRYYRNERNLGISRSLNEGLALAKGMYIARMDADDISLPGRIAAQVKYLSEHPEVGVLGSAVQRIDEQGRRLSIVESPHEHAVLRWLLCFLTPIAHPTVMMRKEIVTQVGGYDSSYQTAEDYDLWRRVSSITRLSNLHSVQVLLRTHEGNASKKQVAQQSDNCVKVSVHMMEEILGAEVSADAVRCIWTREIEDREVASEVACLISRLYERVTNDSDLTQDGHEIVRNGAAAYMVRLAAARSYHSDTWPLLGSALRIAPSFAIRLTIRQLGSKMLRVLRQQSPP